MFHQWEPHPSEGSTRKLFNKQSAFLQAEEPHRYISTCTSSLSLATLAPIASLVSQASHADVRRIITGELRDVESLFLLLIKQKKL